jgi:gas vesicle protein
MGSQSEGRDFLLGFIFGGLVGAVLALLFAPQSGEETRAQIKETGIELQDRAVGFSEEVRRRAEELSAEAQKRAEELTKEISKATEEWSHKLDEHVAESKQPASGPTESS